MDSFSSNLRLSSPLSSKNTIFKDPDTIDQDYLYTRLNVVLFTLQAEKEQFQEKVAAEKRLLEQKVAEQEQKMKELELKNEKLEQEARQLRFNYHQRGSVVDYLKKKVTIIEKKFDSEKEEMLSVIKYLESRNYQLNEIIFELKQKEVQLNQTLFSLQQKYFKLTNQYCFKNLNETSHLKVHVRKPPLQRQSLCHKPSHEPLTPTSMTIKPKHGRMTNSMNENNPHANFTTLQDSHVESLEDSTIREKTVKIQNAINRAKSEENINFSLLNNFLTLDSNRPSSKNSQLQHIPGKGILINNYGHLSFTDIPVESRGVGIRKTSMGGNMNRPKSMLQGHGRYVTELNSKKASKEVTSSRQLI